MRLISPESGSYGAEDKKTLAAKFAQVAELLGAPYRTVQNWFNGTHQPSPWIERLVVEKIYNSV